MSILATRTTADSIVYVIIRNSNGYVYQTTTQQFVEFVDGDLSTYDILMSEQGTSSGYYEVAFPSEITTPGEYNVEFFRQLGASPDVTDIYIAGGEFEWDGSAEADSEIADNLISLGYAKAWLRITDSTYDSQLRTMIAMASSAIVSYCGRGLKNKDYVEYYDVPQPTCRLALHNYPVNLIDEVTLDPYGASVEVVPGNEYMSTSGGIITLKPSSSYSVAFPAGPQSVKVQYTAGYTSIPDDLKGVCVQLVSKLFYPNKDGRDPNIVREKIGQYEVQYKAYATADTFMSLEIKNVLDAKYKRWAVI